MRLKGKLSKSLQKAVGVAAKSKGFVVEKKPRYLSLLNGLIGDTLHARKSNWAIDMSFQGKVRGGKLCILVHGLCDSEETWAFPEDPKQNYGTLLQQDLGYAPLFVRYNSGLHISTNGRMLARRLSEMPQINTTVKEIILIGHSMGGLVVRSACHYGQREGAAWVNKVKTIFLLGAPHLGTDWEKLGHLTSTILKIIPNLFTRWLAALGDMRSAGIKDLRFGYLLDEDWQNSDAGPFWKDNSHTVPLLEGVDYFLVSAALAKKSDHFLIRYFGDGLVPTRSASGRSFRKSRNIPFSENSFKIIKGLSHMKLAHDRNVYKQIREWMEKKR